MIKRQSSRASIISRTATLAFAGGLRSQTPLGSLAAAAGRGEFATNATGLLGLFRRGDVQLALKSATVGELLVDKLPFTPSRLQPGPLFGRIALASLAGAAFAKEHNQPVALGIVVGAAASAAGNFAGYYARRAITESTGIPDPAVAIVEDAVAIGLAYGAVSR